MTHCVRRKELPNEMSAHPNCQKHALEESAKYRALNQDMKLKLIHKEGSELNFSYCISLRKYEL